MSLNNQVRELLIENAYRFEVASFIPTDPISLPHRYTAKGDIEVSAFISAWMAYGSRIQFLKVLEHLHREMDRVGGPYAFIMSRAYKELSIPPETSLYRFYRWADFYALCGRLYQVLQHNPSLEADNIELRRRFSGINGIPNENSQSANKRLHMFLRWMVRCNSAVDFGLWQSVLSPAQLIIPLDTHVYHISRQLGLTNRSVADLKCAIQITDILKDIWPDDPVRGDFALYGMGINTSTTTLE